MKKYILILMLLTPLYTINALELADRKTAAEALYKYNKNIDIHNKLFFGFKFGIPETDIINVIGNPSAILESKKGRYLYYGDDVVFKFYNDKFVGVTAGIWLYPDYLKEKKDVYYIKDEWKPKWTIGKLKFRSPKFKVEKALDIRSFHVESKVFNEKKIKNIKIQLLYIESPTNCYSNIEGLSDLKLEFLYRIQIDQIKAGKEKPLDSL